jgi:SAM-dependent methyltransferase
MSGLKELEDKIIGNRISLRAAIEEYTALTGQAFVPWAPHPPDEKLINARLVSSRYRIIEAMPKRSVCVEVGTQTGAFAKEILARADPRELHVIDVDYSTFRYDLLQPAIDSGTLRVHEGFSSEVLNGFPECYFDWIYIDADHALAGVRADIVAATRVLKPEGYLIFNDYTVWSPAEVSPYGILLAVNELIVSGPWEVIYFAFHGQGYHDICLRRMMPTPIVEPDPRQGEVDPAAGTSG